MIKFGVSKKKLLASEFDRDHNKTIKQNGG